MPFIKKNHAQDAQRAVRGHALFVGRANEILFFVHQILQPECPTHNILSISGQGGIGKSTLLARFLDKAHGPGYHEYCLAALVDERQSTPVSIMEHFASQLHMTGAFEKALKQYKEALRHQQKEQETFRDTLLQTTPDVAGAVIEGIPLAGPLLREGTKIASTHLLKGYHASQTQRSAEFLEHSIDELTTAFVIELNHLADANVTLSATGQKRQRCIVLFLDTFEKTATEVVPWLLHHFLTAQVSGNVVLVVAGRDSIEHATHDPKPWLPYRESGVIFWMPLHSFTEEETRTYLNTRGITDSERVTTIWHLSRGLPLYLGLLASDLHGDIDPTKDVVANFLRWISEQEAIKRQLALEAALLSRPFNQDDLEAFSSIPESDRFSLYQWLTEQPFVRSQSQNGRYLYHDVARDLFARHLYQRSPKGYYAVRQRMAAYYQELLQAILTERGEKEGYSSEEGFELLLAVITQWFLLPDRGSHFKAVEHVLHAVMGNTSDEQDKKIAQVLSKLLKAYSSSQTSPHAIDVAELLSQYLEAGTEGRLSALSALLDKFSHSPLLSTSVLARLYHTRGWSHFNLHQMDYQHAIGDFDQALQLNPELANAYTGRGWCYFNRDERHKALADFDRALQLDPKESAAYNGRGYIYMDLKKYEQALADFDLFIKVMPQNPWTYIQHGRACTALKQYEQALADFNQALQIVAPDDLQAHAYHYRGVTYLWLKKPEQARADLIRGLELDPTWRYSAWVTEWAKMEREGPDGKMTERLEAIAGTNPKAILARLCHAVALWLGGSAQEALAELEQLTQLESSRRYWDGGSNWMAYFWLGLVCASLGQDEETMTALEQVLEELPPALFTPLHWLASGRSDFYANSVVPLLAQFE
jgi:tetratricopeptide (TPR) repeat protein